MGLTGMVTQSLSYCFFFFNFLKHKTSWNFIKITTQKETRGTAVTKPQTRRDKTVICCPLSRLILSSLLIFLFLQNIESIPILFPFLFICLINIIFGLLFLMGFFFFLSLPILFVFFFLSIPLWHPSHIAPNSQRKKVAKISLDREKERMKGRVVAEEGHLEMGWNRKTLIFCSLTCAYDQNPETILLKGKKNLL